MNDIRLLLTSIWYTRTKQLLARLHKTVRRQIEQRVRPGLLGYPLWWYHPSPLRREDPINLSEVVVQSSGREKLPFEVNLAGLSYKINLRTDWAMLAFSKGTRLEKLTLHYMEYLLEIDPEERTKVVLDWIDRVPPWSFEYWKDDWNSYALSIRVFIWIQILLDDGFILDSDASKMIDKSLVRQIRFLLRNLESDIGGNHLVRNARALLAGAAWFGGTEGDKFRRIGERLLQQILDDQILPDGVHFELSPAYHLQVVSDLVDCLALLPIERRFAWLEKLGPMIQFAADTTHPDGYPSLFADAGLHMTTLPSIVFERWVKLGQTKPSPAPVWVRLKSGYAGLRCGEDLLIYDFGPIGADHLPAHGHGDVFALEWSVDGKRFLVDAGVFEYHPGKLRKLSRATSSHNTVMLDRMDHAEFWGSFRVGNRPKITIHSATHSQNGFDIDAEHDGYRLMTGKPRVRRRIRARPGRVEVRDQTLGGNGQCMEAALLLSPDIGVREIGDIWLLEHIDGPALRLKSDYTITVEEATWMPDFGKRINTLRIWMKFGAAPCLGNWSLERI